MKTELEVHELEAYLPSAGPGGDEALDGEVDPTDVPKGADFKIRRETDFELRWSVSFRRERCDP